MEGTERLRSTSSSPQFGWRRWQGGRKSTGDAAVTASFGRLRGRWRRWRRLGAPAADYFGREVEEVEVERHAWSYGRGGSRSDGARRRLPRLGFGARGELGREGKRAREIDRERG
jgi:hypothetical protein